MTLSGQLTRVHFDDIAAGDRRRAPAQSPRRRASRPASCIEFTESGTVARTHAPTRAASSGRAERARRRLPRTWLVDAPGARRGGGHLAAGGAARARRWRRGSRRARRGACSILGVPASVAGQVVCALVIDSGRAAAAMAAAAGRTAAAHCRRSSAPRCSAAATRTRCAPASPRSSG